MTMDGNGTASGGAAPEVRVFSALPDRTEDGQEHFSASLAEVVRVLRLHVPTGRDADSRRTWEQHVRVALREACLRGMALSEESFDVLVSAAVHDPNPSFNRQFVEPAVQAFGQTRVRVALLGHLRTGTDAERAGAARAWYWTGMRPKMPRVKAAGSGTATPPDTLAEETAVVAEWNRTALREFVENEHLDVRRCLLPGLPLRKSVQPPELHGLVDAAVAIARSHPDAYIRHRVENQVGD